MAEGRVWRGYSFCLLSVCPSAETGVCLVHLSARPVEGVEGPLQSAGGGHGSGAIRKQALDERCEERQSPPFVTNVLHLIDNFFFNNSSMTPLTLEATLPPTSCSPPLSDKEARQGGRVDRKKESAKGCMDAVPTHLSALG